MWVRAVSVAALCTMLAALASGCGDSSSSASTEERAAMKAACARIEDFAVHRQNSDIPALRTDLDAAVREAARSGDDAFRDHLEIARDAFQDGQDRESPMRETMAANLRAGAHFDLAQVECLEDGHLRFPL